MNGQTSRRFLSENYFQPTFQKFAGELCAGAQLHVNDRDQFRPFATGVEIIRHPQNLYPDHFRMEAPPYEYERIIADRGFVRRASRIDYLRLGEEPYKATLHSSCEILRCAQG